MNTKESYIYRLLDGADKNLLFRCIRGLIVGKNKTVNCFC